MTAPAEAPLTIVSVDSHAACPPELWRTYLEPEYHHLLPSLEQNNADYTAALRFMTEYAPAVLAAVDEEGLIAAGGRAGAWDRSVRLREMDREGVAAELVFFGDPQVIALWHTLGSRPQPDDVQAAGRRAYHRWAADNMSDGGSRLLLVGDCGPCFDLESTVRELTWLKEHGFVGVYLPGFIGRPDLPPLHDDHFEQIWSACEDLDLALVIHAGYGQEQGSIYESFAKLGALARKGRDAFQEFVNNTEESFFALDLRPRRAMWQLMLGGVFDRHPRLKLIVSEVRADWVPQTLQWLDGWFDQGRSRANTRPSDLWRQHCLAGVSFVKRCEVEMRAEIGVQTIAFGRDYPHPEGTWPKTWDHLRYVLDGVPADEARLMLGGNAVRFCGLDGAALAATAERIGAPRPSDLLSGGATVDAERVAAFHARSGLLKPAEQVDTTAIEELVSADFGR